MTTPAAKRRPQIFTEPYEPVVLAPTLSWNWATVGVMAMCMVGYIIASIDTSSIWLPLQ